MTLNTETLAETLLGMLERWVIEGQNGARHAFNEADFHRQSGLLLWAVQWQRDMAMAHEQVRTRLEKLIYLQGPIQKEPKP